MVSMWVSGFGSTFNENSAVKQEVCFIYYCCVLTLIHLLTIKETIQSNNRTNFRSCLKSYVINENPWFQDMWNTFIYVKIRVTIFDCCKTMKSIYFRRDTESAASSPLCVTNKIHDPSSMTISMWNRLEESGWLLHFLFVHEETNTSLAGSHTRTYIEKHNQINRTWVDELTYNVNITTRRKYVNVPWG